MASNSFSDAFGQISAALGGGDAVLLLPIGLIDEDPNNPRRHFDEPELAALAETIGRKGLLQPLTVRPQGSDGRYQLRFGARRLRAARMAGLTEVRALVQPGELDAPEAIVEQLIENDQREGLSTAELARAVAQLLELNVTQAEIGRRLGRSKEQIAMLASIREMPPELQALAPRLGVRTLYELHKAWKSDPGRIKIWLTGRDPGAITQAVARELAGRPVPSRQVVGDPSDGSIREKPSSPASAPARSRRASAPPPAPDDAAPAHGSAVFEVKARGVTGTLVLDNVRAPSAGVLVRLADGSLRPVPAADIRIVRVRPG